MAFRFRLEKILQLKIKLRDAKKAELSYINSKIKSLNKRLEEVRHNIKNLSHPKQTVSFYELNNCYATLERLIYEEKALTEEIQNLEKERGRIVDELIELQKDVKILEKLKEKKYEEFRREILRKEIKLLDELAIRGKLNA